jgi:hypothetical protein
MPKINASDDELMRQVDRGAVGPTSGNLGGAMSGAGGIRGGGAGLGANPSRTGPYNPVAGSYMHQPGSPPGGVAAVRPGNVPVSSLGGASNAKLAMLAHGRTLGAVAHLRGVHGDHPHLQMAHAKATAGISSYKNSMKKQGLPGGPKFGALGGSSGTGGNGSLIPSAGPNASGMAPLGAAQLPDEL